MRWRPKRPFGAIVAAWTAVANASASESSCQVGRTKGSRFPLRDLIIVAEDDGPDALGPALATRDASPLYSPSRTSEISKSGVDSQRP